MSSLFSSVVFSDSCVICIKEHEQKINLCAILSHVYPLPQQTLQSQMQLPRRDKIWLYMTILSCQGTDNASVFRGHSIRKSDIYWRVVSDSCNGTLTWYCILTVLCPIHTARGHVTRKSQCELDIKCIINFYSEIVCVTDKVVWLARRPTIRQFLEMEYLKIAFYFCFYRQSTVGI